MNVLQRSYCRLSSQHLPAAQRATWDRTSSHVSTRAASVSVLAAGCLLDMLDQFREVIVDINSG